MTKTTPIISKPKASKRIDREIGSTSPVEGADLTSNDEVDVLDEVIGLTDQIHETILNVETTGEGRIDKILPSMIPDMSRARIQALIAQGQVFLDGMPITDMSKKIRPGQQVRIVVPPPISALPEPQNLPIDIIYEDEDLLVINKAAGMVVHPAAGAWDGTLVNALLYHCANSLSGIGGVLRPGIVHRLDKDTSGLMMVAKNDKSHQYLSEQLSDHTLSRVYHAIVWGTPILQRGRIETLIGRNARDRQRMEVRRHGGRIAVTDYQLLHSVGEATSLVECRLQTGRTHQIRVHMANLGFPIVGDKTYGRKTTTKPKGLATEEYDILRAFQRQALHAKEISFLHPKDGEEMHFECDYPTDFLSLLELANY